MTTVELSQKPAIDIFAAQAAKKSPSLTELAWRRFRKDKLAMFGLFLLVLLGTMAVLATPLSEFVTRYSPEKIQPL